MQTEVTKLQPTEVQEQLTQPAVKSVCRTYEDELRLKKLFEIFIEIDKKLAKKYEDSNRNTGYTGKAK